jgi:hypothetical protein
MPSKTKQISRKLVSGLITSRRRDIPFLIFLTFLATFIVSRAYIYITNHDILESIFSVDYITIANVHIHHFIWGILLISISGFISLISTNPHLLRRLAIVYGIGLGLTFDEFAIWLKLDSNYFSRLSYDSIITISLLLINIVYFRGFWKRLGKNMKYLFHPPTYLKRRFLFNPSMKNLKAKYKTQ